MNVRTLCLAILHHQDATGYEIRKLSTEGKYAYFVDASFGSIYPALAKLEDEGLVSCRLEQQDGKPARKVYSMNDGGRAELRANLRESPTPDVFRSEFLLIAMCADLLDVGDMERALTVHISQVEDELQKIDEMKSEMPEGSWLADYGTTCMKTQLSWLHANRDRILADSAEIALNAPQRTPPPNDVPKAAPVAAE
ncbi:MAG: PadR family transcriptional regulator [Hyphomicrobiales bacterium]|jgi:PadR family transcriptional regulator AphA